MTLAKRKISKTTVQPAQYEMTFARVRARFADLGAIGLISVSLTFPVTLLVLTALYTTPEEFYLRPAIMAAQLPAFLFLAIVIATELVRSMRWTDRKDLFVAAHAAAIIGTLGLVASLMLTQKTVAEQYDTARAAAAQKKALEKIKEWEVKKAEEARAGEGARRAEQDCFTARSAALESATRRKTNASANLRRCRDEFEKNKTIFTATTADVQCREWRRELFIASEDVKTASALTCAPSATGTIGAQPRPVNPP